MRYEREEMVVSARTVLRSLFLTKWFKFRQLKQNACSLHWSVQCGWKLYLPLGGDTLIRTPGEKLVGTKYKISLLIMFPFLDEI